MNAAHDDDVSADGRPAADQAGAPPLAGIVVVDLTQIYNGPYATFLLAQAGAEIIKVEPPGGEHLRRRVPSRGVTEPFAMLNPNKRSIEIDLKAAAGRALLLRLVAKADVCVENFAPGVMERLGLGEAALRAANPTLVIASGSGYGNSGPYRNYPAMDVTMQAMSGVISVTGQPDEPAVKAGPAVCDFFGGVHLYGAIVTALYKRAVTGAGSTLEVAMMASVFPSLLSNLGMADEHATTTRRTGNRHGGLTMAPYNVYPTADGAIAILSVDEYHWQAIARLLGHDEWVRDPRFSSKTARIEHMDALDAAIGEATAREPKAALFARLVDARVPCAPVRELPEVINDEHLHATGMLRWVDHPTFGRILAHGSPLVFKDVAVPPYRPSAALGSDAHAILAEHLSIDDDGVAALVADGALPARDGALS